MEGVSLIPAIHGKSLKRTAPLFFEHEGNRAVRDGKWKLVSKFMGPWELYDMEADRTETKNVIDQHPRIAERLMAAYEAYAKRAYVEPWPGQKRTDWGSEIKSPAS
jgi:arylsulfatase